jgi:hypothetical protein
VAAALQWNIDLKQKGLLVRLSKVRTLVAVPQGAVCNDEIVLWGEKQR